MAENVFDWSTTAADNATADAGINWQENQTPGSVNGSARAMMAALAKFLKDNNGTKTTGGSANAQTLAAPNTAYGALVNGLLIGFKAGFSNTGAATFNLNSLGAKKIRKFANAAGTASESELAAGEIGAGGHYWLRYDAAADSGNGAWIVLNPTPDTSLSERTGVIKDYIGTTAPTGYVLASGRTIGNAASGATERANADTVNLFTLLWNSLADAQAAVSGGRGASAAADFAANKTIALPDLRGRVTAGKDDMGGAAASRLTAGGSGIAGATLGATGGAETHTLNLAQLAAHAHTLTTASAASGGAHAHTASSAAGGSHNHGGATTNDLQDHTHSGTTNNDSPDHTHGYNTPDAATGAYAAGGFGAIPSRSSAATLGASARHQHAFTTGGVNSNHTHGITADGSHTHTITVDSGGAHVHALSGATDNAGSGSAHNNAQPSFIVNKIIKL